MSIFNDYLVLGNVWDVTSALSCQKIGFRAIGTSSAAVAASLGYEDGEDMPFSELLNVVERIRRKVDLPLTVDIEAGYADAVEKKIAHIDALADLGVVGVNIEDSVVENGVRRILPAEEFARIIGNIKTAVADEVFLNARTDAYIMGLGAPLETTLERAMLYEQAGADGVFVPCITKLDDIKRVVNAVKIPLNVMCMPELAEFEVLRDMGVKRISMGPFLYNKMVAQFEQDLGKVMQQQNFGAIFSS